MEFHYYQWISLQCGQQYMTDTQREREREDNDRASDVKESWHLHACIRPISNCHRHTAIPIDVH